MLLGSSVPQVWMYAMLQHFDSLHFASMMSFYCGLGCCLAVAAILWLLDPKRTAPRWVSRAAGLSVCGTSLFLAVPFGFGEPAAAAACAVGGAGVGWCFLRWFLLYSAFDLKDGTGYMLLSFSLVAVATLAFSALASMFGVSVMLLLAPFPVAAAVLCERFLARVGKTGHSAEPDSGSRPLAQLHLRQILPIAFELAVYALVLGLLRGQGAPAGPLDAATLLNLLLRAVFPLVLVLWIGVQFKPKGFIDISQAVLIFIIISLLALALLGDEGALVAAALVSLARNIVLVLLSVVLLYIVHSSPFHPFTVYGAGRLIHTLSTQAGFAAASMLDAGGGSVGTSLNVVFFAVACIFVFLANRSVKTVRLFSSENVAVQEPGRTLVEARCDELKDGFDLTDREVEVMKLIAAGRSRSYIADALFISENTVRWHAKRLYAKLGIHSKQELLTLVGFE